MGILDGERKGLDGLQVIARKLGMSAEFVIGILVNFAAWGHNCGRMSAALRESCGFAEEETAFLDAFANMPSFEEVALGIIQDGLDSGENPARLLRSARLFQAYELMFWNAMAEAAKTA